MERISSFEKVILPFRAPEIDSAIKSFPKDLLFYNDEQDSPRLRFEVWDQFTSVFQDWSQLFMNGFHFYPTAGATEAIICSLLSAKNKNKRLIFIENEYSFYKACAEIFEIPFVIATDDFQFKENDIFITSLPFCRTGVVEHIQAELMRKAECQQIEVWLDLVYLGTTTKIDIKLTLNVTNVFFSFSKQFGLSLSRIGLWCSRCIISERELLMKFGYYSVGSYALATDLMHKFPVDWLYNHYAEVQRKVAIEPTGIVYLCKTRGCLTKEIESIIHND